MNQFQFLRPHQLSKTRVDYTRWPHIMFLAESEGERFADATIVTSDAYRSDRAFELAFAFGATLESVDRVANKIRKTLPTEQFVETFRENILVVIDSHAIDDNTINKAFVMLSQVPEFKVGQRIMFDEPKSHHQYN